MKERDFTVFLSHVMDLAVDDLRAEVNAISLAISRFDHLDLVTFEHSAASGEDPRTRSLRRVQEADVLLLVLGRDVTDAVEAEVTRARECGRPLWVFVREPEPHRSTRAKMLLGAIRHECTYETFRTAADLQAAVEATTQDETPRLMRRGVESRQEFVPPPWIGQNAGPVDHEYGPALDRLAAALGESEKRRLEAELQLARGHLDSGRYSKAREAYVKLKSEGSVIRFKELHRKVLNNLAVSCCLLGKKMEALEASQEALKLDPGSEAIRLTHLANLLYFSPEVWKMKGVEERDLLERTTTGLEMLSSEARESGNHAKALEYAIRALELDPTSEAAQLNAAYSAGKLGQREQALQLLEKIGPQSRFYMQAQISLGEMKFQAARLMRDPGKAITDVEAHVEKAETAAGSRQLSPDDWSETRAHKDVVVAGLAILGGRPEEAIRLLQTQDSTLIPEVVLFHNLGQAYAAREEWDKAIEMFERVLAVDPDNLDVLDWLSVALMTRFTRTEDGGDLKKAEESLRLLLSRRPTGIVVLNLVEILVMTERLPEAKELILRASAGGLGDIEVDVARLRIAVREGDEERAAEIAMDIYQRNPTEVTAALFLGRRDYDEGRYAEAREKLQNAIADPFCKWSSHPEAYAFLARALKRLGQVQRAIEIAMQGVKRCPGDKRLPRILDELVSKQT